MSMRNRMELRVAIAGILALAAGAAATAQESKAPETMVLEEIVVTAEKRRANLQDVPVAISAFTSETRDLIGITNIQDLTDFTPGLSYASTLDRMSLRGVGRLTNNYGSDPGIATYSDGFYTASNVEAGKAPMFTDRIEVLRGPQGTLYGRNSIGGALNVVSKRPTETTQGEVRASAGSYDLQTYAGSISGPITDWLRYRVAANGGGQGEGFFEDVNSNETEGGQNDDMYAEAQLAFNIGEAMDGWVKYARSEWDQARRVDRRITPYDIAPTSFGAPAVIAGPSGPIAGLFPNPTFGFTGTNPALTDERQYDTDTPFRTKLDDVDIVTLETVNHFGGVDLKYVGGYQGYTYQQVSDFDGIDRDPFTVTNAGGQSLQIFPTIEAFYHEDKEYYSNELNLISTGDGPFQWIVGLYQYHEQVNQFQGIRAPLQPHLANPRASGAERRQRLQPAGRRAESAEQSAERRCAARSRCVRGVQPGRLSADRHLEDHDRRALHRRREGRGRVPPARRVPGQPGAAVLVLLRERDRAPRRQVERRDGHGRSRVVAERGPAGVRQVHARLQERRLQRRRDGAGPHRLHRA